MAGHVRKRASGSWQAMASFRDETGKLIQLTRTLPTKKEADDVLPELLSLARKKSRPAAPMTVNDLLDLWWEVHAPKLAESTRKIDRLVMDKHIRARIGNMKLRTVTGYHVDRLYNQLADDGLGAHAIRHVHNILRRAFGQGVKYKWLPDNPAADATPPPAPKQRGNMPGPEEFGRLVEAADKLAPWYGVYLRLTTIMAGRRGEMTALRWGDFHEAENVVMVDEALSIGDRGVTVKGPKEEHSYRPLNIGPQMTRLLVDYRTQIEEKSMWVTGPILDSDFIFTTDPTRKRPMNPATASRYFKKVREAAGMPGLRLHDMRKVAATWLVKEGISAPTVSHRLGHSRNSTTVTWDVYTRRVPAEDAAAGGFMDRMVNGVGTGQNLGDDEGEFRGEAV